MSAIVDVIPPVPAHTRSDVPSWTCMQTLSFLVDELAKNGYRTDIVSKARESAIAFAELIDAHRELLTGIGLDDIPERVLIHQGKALSHRVIRSRSALSRMGNAQP